MKNYNRAYNRHKQQTNFKKRAKKNYHWLTENSWADFWKSVQEGQEAKWLRHTRKICSCTMCSYKKYKREPKNKRIGHIA